MGAAAPTVPHVEQMPEKQLPSLITLAGQFPESGFEKSLPCQAILFAQQVNRGEGSQRKKVKVGPPGAQEPLGPSPTSPPPLSVTSLRGASAAERYQALGIPKSSMQASRLGGNQT